ncbi:hypothetical protein OG413_31760 [Streptomyces sp. NBC_01433]|uniref:hypothetical protein n=1 Tax=unclassified Streptomyces TaxID=2593676 RepID=UPI000A3F3354|nr:MULTISPECIES: hypothetical protein [unclassified Streptomyces]MCX4679808.1 hypothetical protein [Streptomyces sp. NBC_01433]
MGRTADVRKCLQEATSVLRPAAAAPAAPAAAIAPADGAPGTGRTALHGHG